MSQPEAKPPLAIEAPDRRLMIEGFKPEQQAEALYVRIHAPSNWLRLQHNGSYVLLDPTTGERLNYNAPPAMIERDPVLRAGLDFWRQNAANIEITNLFALHSKAADLGNSTEFEERAQRADLFAYESFMSTAENEEVANESARVIMGILAAVGLKDDPEAFIKEYGLFAKDKTSDFSWAARLRRAIVTNPNNSTSFDIRLDGTQLERQLIMFDAVLTLVGSLPEARAAKIALNNVREWIMVATLGLKARAIFGNELKSTITIAALFGAGHADVTRKLKCLGVEAGSVFLNKRAMPPEAIEAIEAFRRVGRTTRVSLKDIEDVVQVKM